METISQQDFLSLAAIGLSSGLVVGLIRCLWRYVIRALYRATRQAMR